ncbi:MAG: YbjQ family protein [bacterium]|nr:YbjQ family protein [bacterium]
MIELSIILALTLITSVTGTIIKNRHLKSLKIREQRFAHIPVVTDPALGPTETLTHFVLIQGHAVIATDYFRSLWAGLRQIFGGSVGAYEQLIDRARREATVRLKEKAVKMGADAVVDVRFESPEISRMMAEMYVYGTAVFIKAPSSKQGGADG